MENLNNANKRRRFDEPNLTPSSDLERNETPVSLRNASAEIPPPPPNFYQPLKPLILAPKPIYAGSKQSLKSSY